MYKKMHPPMLIYFLKTCTINWLDHSIITNRQTGKIEKTCLKVDILKICGRKHQVLSVVLLSQGCTNQSASLTPRI